MKNLYITILFFTITNGIIVCSENTKIIQPIGNNNFKNLLTKNNNHPFCHMTGLALTGFAFAKTSQSGLAHFIWPIALSTYGLTLIGCNLTMNGSNIIKNKIKKLFRNAANPLKIKQK
jgi:hypothetical protein